MTALRDEFYTLLDRLGFYERDHHSEVYFKDQECTEIDYVVYHIVGHGLYIRGTMEQLVKELKRLHALKAFF